MNFKERLMVEYPLPSGVSIWEDGGNTHPELTAVESLDNLIQTCVDELRSDILVTQYMQARGMRTKMPDDTLTVLAAKLSSNYMFQGNRLVKVSYDKGQGYAYVNYYPCTLTYRRFLRVEDLAPDTQTIFGDQLIYVKAYIFWKMAAKELQVLEAVNMLVDNGQVDFKVLEQFRDEARARYEQLKPEILIYSSSW